MDDDIRATIELMVAPMEIIRTRTSYNLSGVSFSPTEIIMAIQAHYPDFKAKFAPDYRQEIAAKWPDSINDLPAQNDWGWQPEFNLDKLVLTMLTKLREKYKTKKIQPPHQSAVA